MHVHFEDVLASFIFYVTACGGTVNIGGSNSAVLSPPMNGTTGNYTQRTLCKWTVVSSSQQQGQTTVFSADQLFLPEHDHGYCTDKLRLFGAGTGSTIDEATSFGTFCGHRQTKLTVASPHALNYAVFVSTASPADRGFNLTALTLPCGGILVDGPQTLTSPGYPHTNYPPDYDCVWLLDYPEGSQVQINRDDFSFDLGTGTDGCNGDYLEIRNGGEPDSPVLWRGCGSNGIPDAGLRSMSNQMWVAFHSTGAASSGAGGHRGFTLTAR